MHPPSDQRLGELLGEGASICGELVVRRLQHLRKVDVFLPSADGPNFVTLCRTVEVRRALQLHLDGQLEVRRQSFQSDPSLVRCSLICLAGQRGEVRVGQHLKRTAILDAATTVFRPERPDDCADLDIVKTDDILR